MKTLLTILFTVAISISIFGQIDNSEYTFAIKKGKYEKVGNQIYLIVPTTLTNNTNDTLKYLSMSCSWRKSYYLDNNKLSIEKYRCIKNVQITLILPPHQSVDREIKLTIEQATKTFKFKIGFSLIKVKNNLLYEFSEQEKERNIIWSNTITQTNTIYVENIVEFYKFNDRNYSNEDAINFILKVSNHSKNPIPDLGVTNRSKYVNFYINGKIDNPLSLYNGPESTYGLKTIATDSTQTFNSGGWILSLASGLLTKYGNEFTVQWEYMNIKSEIIRVNVDEKKFVIKHKQESIEFKEIQTICEQYIEKNIAVTECNGTAFCSSELLGIDNNNIYLWIYCEEYYLKDNQLIKGSGLFEPICIKIDGNNKVINHSLPQEGIAYTKDIKRIFPKQIIESEDLLGIPSEEFSMKYNERGKRLGEKNLLKANEYYKLN